MDLFVRAARDRRIHDHNVAIKAAYWSGRWAREKTMTDPATVMIEEGARPAGDGKGEAQTEEDMAAAMAAWARAMPDVFTFKTVKKRRRGKKQES